MQCLIALFNANRYNAHCVACPFDGRSAVVPHFRLFPSTGRCFPTKIFRLWRDTDDLQHIALIGAFLHYADRFGPAEAEEITESRASDPMYVVRAKATGNRADL